MHLLIDIFRVIFYIGFVLIGTAICLPLLGIVLALYLGILLFIILIPYIPYMVIIGLIYWLLTLANVFPLK